MADTLSKRRVSAINSVVIGHRRSLREAVKNFIDDPTDATRSKVEQLMDEYQTASVRLYIAKAEAA